MQRPIRRAPLPQRAVIPLYQSLGVAAAPIVRVGDRVLTGQRIAETATGSTTPGARIHATISGRVAAIETRPGLGPARTDGTCIVIDSDGRDERHPDCRPENSDALSPGNIIARIGAAGIVGLGGALFDTAAKLRSGRGLRGLILNGAECEPYISCDEMLMRERASEVVRGAAIMRRALGDADIVIAIENDMPEVRVALRDAVEEAGLGFIDVAVVTAKYPAGGERQLVELLTGLEVPAHGLPTDIGYLCHNVATAAAVARLFATGEPLISRIVTLTGDCIAEPVNYEARIGMPIAELIAAHGGYADTPERLLVGGPMMGVALSDDSAPITRATNCIIALRATAERAQHPERPCIRCAECSEVCPARLLPQQLIVACRGHDMAALDELSLDACIECGCCDYVCPSYIPLTARFVAAKHELLEHKLARERAVHARERYDTHEARLAEAEAQEARELEEQLAELDGTRTIEQLMLRVEQQEDD